LFFQKKFPAKLITSAVFTPGIPVKTGSYLKD